MKRAGLKILLATAVILILSCHRGSDRADHSGSATEVHIKRLEKDLFSADPFKIPLTADSLKAEYGRFLQYFSYVINIGEVGDSAWKEGLLRFCTDRQNNEVYLKTVEVFPDVKKIEKELSAAFRNFRRCFPGKPVPAIYTCISGFNNSIITGDSTLGISLDRYLGKDCKYYPQLGIYKYQAAKMTPEYIVTDCIYGLAASEWDYNTAGYSPDNVLSAIIHEGKLLWVVKRVLSHKPDEIIFGFTGPQMKFCRSNEGAMWEYFIENNLLFSTDMLTRKKLIGEAPFTSYFSKESPGRAAACIGYRIIESYMKHNRKTTPEELMRINDPQEILSKARYSPVP